MRQIPGELAAQLQRVEDLVAGLEEVGSQDVFVTLDQGADETATHMGQGRAPTRGGQADQMLYPSLAPLIHRQPGANDQHAGGVSDDIELVVEAESGFLA